MCTLRRSGERRCEHGPRSCPWERGSEMLTTREWVVVLGVAVADRERRGRGASGGIAHARPAADRPQPFATGKRTSVRYSSGGVSLGSERYDSSGGPTMR